MAGTEHSTGDGQRVRISRDGPERYRWLCPNGHLDWSRTNSHIWCRGCRRASERGRDVDPEHYHIVDAKTDREIDWDAVVIDGEEIVA